MSSVHWFLLQRGKFRGSKSPALLFPPICRGARRFLSSSCEGRKEIQAVEYLHQCFGWRKEERKVLFVAWKKKELGNTSRGSVHGLECVSPSQPFQSLWQTGFNRRECHFWWELMEKAAQSCV